MSVSLDAAAIPVPIIVDEVSILAVGAAPWSSIYRGNVTLRQYAATISQFPSHAKGN